MPKMQVYLPAELYERVKARGASLNVSSILQAALEEALAELERRAALDEAVGAYEKRHGRITAEELAAQEAQDRSTARRSTAPRRRRTRVA